jgi:hypothetical protein
MIRLRTSVLRKHTEENDRTVPTTTTVLRDLAADAAGAEPSCTSSREAESRAWGSAHTAGVWCSNKSAISQSGMRAYCACAPVGSTGLPLTQEEW